MHLIEDCILYPFLGVELQDPAISIFHLDLANTTTSNVFALCKVEAVPKQTIFFPSDDGQDYPFCVLILPILRRFETLGKVLLAMPFPMFPEVIAFCFADFEP